MMTIIYWKDGKKATTIDTQPNIDVVNNSLTLITRDNVIIDDNNFIDLDIRLIKKIEWVNDYENTKD